MTFIIYLSYWLSWVFVAVLGLSLVGQQRLLFFAVHRLLFVEAPVAPGTRASVVAHLGSEVVTGKP